MHIKDQSKTAVKVHAVNICERVLSIRRELRVSQKEMAAKLGIAPSYLSMIEKGRNKPNIDFLVKLATTYDVNLEYLLLDKGEPLKAENMEEIDITPGDEVGCIEEVAWLADLSPYFKHSLFAWATKFILDKDNESLIVQNIRSWKENQKKGL